MPTDGPPSGHRSSTVHAVRTQSVTEGLYDGVAASTSQASSSASDESWTRYAPRFAASIDPGPPPVATSRPRAARACPSVAARR